MNYDAAIIIMASVHASTGSFAMTRSGATETLSSLTPRKPTEIDILSLTARVIATGLQ
jgi:hypothetical protein